MASPLVTQIIQLLGQRRVRELQEEENERARAAEERTVQAFGQNQAAADFAQRLKIADLIRSSAAGTPLSAAPSQTAEEAGLPPQQETEAGPTPSELRVPQRRITLRTPGGQEIPLAPLQYKEEAEAEKLKTIEKEKEARADVIDVPEVKEWGALAGMKGVRVSTANAYLQALQRRDAAAAATAQRDAVLQAKKLELDLKKQERMDEADSWVRAFERGEGVIGDVPAGLRDEVRARAEKLKIPVATRKLGEPTIEKLTDSQSLISRLDDLDSLESGWDLKVQSKLIPDVVTQYTGIGAKAKKIAPAYFLFTAETLKAIQGSRPSDFDMKTYLDNMPKIGDPPDVKAAKVARLRKQLTGSYNKKVGVYQKQGFNTRGFQLMEEEIEEETPKKTTPALPDETKKALDRLFPGAR